MLKAIKKFVVDHRRDANHEKRPVIEEDHPGEVGSVSNATAEVAEPRDDEPAAALPVLGKVKWYDPNKRYGFVELSDGSGDAFLRATGLAGIGTPTLRSGDTLELRIMLQERGPQVTEVISVVSSIPDAPRRPRRSFRSPSIQQTLAASVQELGTVVTDIREDRRESAETDRNGESGELSVPKRRSPICRSDTSTLVHEDALQSFLSARPSGRRSRPRLLRSRMGR